MATITGGSSVINFTVTTEFTSSRAARSSVHEILNREHPDVTLRPASSRSGKIKLAFLGEDAEAASDLAERVLAEPVTFTYLTDPERPSLALTFVIPDNGRIYRELDATTRDDWTVEIDFREVSS